MRVIMVGREKMRDEERVCVCDRGWKRERVRERGRREGGRESVCDCSWKRKRESVCV